MSKYKAISENEQSIIVRNILNAKDKRKQVQIEADLHESSIDIIKNILKEHGVNLRIFNGGSHKKTTSPKATKRSAAVETTVEQAVAVIRAEIDEINRQKYELDMRKADLYRAIWDMLDEVK